MKIHAEIQIDRDADDPGGGSDMGLVLEELDQVIQLLIQQGKVQTIMSAAIDALTAAVAAESVAVAQVKTAVDGETTRVEKLIADLRAEPPSPAIQAAIDALTGTKKSLETISTGLDKVEPVKSSPLTTPPPVFR